MVIYHPIYKEECDKISVDALHAVAESTKFRTYNCKRRHGLQFDDMLQ
jgi:hypothetical protein